ncbi:Ig-like domain-containing protein, partial [Bisbaumannia pacifica]
YDAEAERDYAVDTTAPAVGVALLGAGDDDVYNIEEIASGEPDSVEALITLEEGTSPGDTLVVTDGAGNTLTTLVLDQQHIASGVTVWVPVADSASSVSVQATVTDPAGNSASADDAKGVVTVEPEASITIDPVFGGDDFLGNDEAQEGQPISGSVGGEAKAGDVIEVVIGGEVYTTTVDDDGSSWSVNVPADKVSGLSSGDITAKVVGEDQYGNAYEAEADRPYEVQPPASLEVGSNDGENLESSGGDDVILGDRGGKETIIDPATNYNISLIVDTSGSMGNSSGTSGLDRMELTKQALVNLANQLKDHEGTINVQLVPFAKHAGGPIIIENLDASNVQSLIDAIDDLEADGGTNYMAGFQEAAAWFNQQNGQPNAADFENLSYFLTDGNPTYYYDDDGDVEGSGSSTGYDVFKASVDAFAELSGLSSVNGIGIGSGISKDYLEFFDNSGVVGTGEVSFGWGWWAKEVTGPIGEVDIVDTAEDLAAALEGSSEFDELEDLGDDTLTGGDGDDILFGDAISTDHLAWTNGDTNESFAAGEHDGMGYQGLREYLKWEVNGGNAPDDEQVIDYVKDNYDSLFDQNPEKGGNDTLIGGADDDILIGGAGDDVFQWQLGDEGGSNAPAVDVVKDFGNGDDVLDVADLLQDEESAVDLGSYVVAEEDGADTVLYLNSQGNLGGDKENADQVIRLEGKSFSDFGATPGDGEDLVAKMIASGQLNIDQ